jgi:NAD(P)-dependent dehydrogenase (short-subunit alcohol dehydrogenase family)
MAVALVTGGGRGIGRVIARQLSADGWTVVVTGRNAVSLDSAVAAGDAALGLPGDATVLADVAAAVAAARTLGDLNLVVANAGLFSASGPIWESDPGDWWRDVEVNLRGPAVLLHAALGDMVARGTGRAVVIGSGIATEPMPWASAYSASKAAVLRLVDSVAGELVGTGVAVFAVSPGLVATDMTEFPEPFLARYPDWRGQALREGRPPEQCADLIATLAGGGYDGLSGRYLHVRDDLAVATASAEAAGTLRLVPYSD